jgi:hypothetical protein
MVVITTLAYPTESTKEMAKRFLEAPSLPDFLTRRGPYVKSSREEGIMTLSIYEMERSKLADAIEYITSYEAIFFGVPGFRYSIEPYLEISEALKTIGMA